MSGTPTRWSLIRYVPFPVTGEYVNVGMIAGRGGDWACRVAVDWTRAAGLAQKQTRIAARDFIHTDIESKIAAATEEWLYRLPQVGSQSIVQVTTPLLVLAEGAAQAIELVYPSVVIERAEASA